MAVAHSLRAACHASDIKVFCFYQNPKGYCYEPDKLVLVVSLDSHFALIPSDPVMKGKERLVTENLVSFFLDGVSVRETKVL